jgi:DNA polymerase V
MVAPIDNSILINKLIPLADELTKMRIEILGTISAGYPSETSNYIEKVLDPNVYLCADKKTTCCLWVFDKAQTGEGISQGDVLVINTSGKPGKTGVNIYWVDDNYVLARIEKRKDEKYLVFLNTDIEPLKIDDGTELISHGSLQFAVKKFSVYNRLLAGFPEEAYQTAKTGVDFNKYLIKYWETTFFLWSGGESMSNDGINKGDLLFVDRWKDASDDSILVIYLNRQFTLKRMVRYVDYIELVSSNPVMPPIKVKNEDEIAQWGVLTTCIKKF